MTSCRCVRLRVNDPPALTFGTDEYTPYVPQIDEYGGPYEVTPSDTAQTLPTRGLLSTDNFVVSPIPSNYGRIEQRGSALYVY